MLFGQLPNKEDRVRCDGDDDERDDAAGLEPIEVLALIERDLQRANPEDQQGETDPVDGQLNRRRLAFLVNEPCHRRSAEPDRDIDVDDPWPRYVVGDPSAEQRT